MKLNAQWICGFTDKEDCFHIEICEDKNMKLGFDVLPEFRITRYKNDIKSLYALKSYFGCGTVIELSAEAFEYRVRGRNLNVVIIPFFKKHKLITFQRVYFMRFCKVLHMVNKEDHLTLEGLARIRKIKQL